MKTENVQSRTNKMDFYTKCLQSVFYKGIELFPHPIVAVDVFSWVCRVVCRGGGKFLHSLPCIVLGIPGHRPETNCKNTALIGSSVLVRSPAVHESQVRMF